MELDEASGEYKVAGQRTMQDFTDGLNLSMPMVQAMFGKIPLILSLKKSLRSRKRLFLLKMNFRYILNIWKGT